MKSFKDYLSKDRTYKYTVKLAVDDVTEDHLDCLECCLEKYELVAAGKFSNTPIQENPLDFPNVKNSPVFITEIEIKYPSTSDMLENLIANRLGISRQQVVVYTEVDPRHKLTDLFLERNADDFKDKYEAKLSKESYEGEDPTGIEPKSLEDQKYELLSELETELKATAEKDKASVLPGDYHSYDEQKEDFSPGLFGRMSPKPKRGTNG